MDRLPELRRLTTDARLLAAVAALAAVSACSESPPPAEPADAGAGLETLVVGGGAAGEERLFDGLIEAVQQATLAAQTTGRVVALERDVDAPVARGQLILRLERGRAACRSRCRAPGPVGSAGDGGRGALDL